jgi:hypothetical protein
MPEKTITGPFNKQVFIKSQRTFWKFSTRGKIKRYVVYALVGIFWLSIGLTSDEQNIFNVGLVAGVACLAYTVFIWIIFVDNRIKFFKKVNQQAQLYEQQQLTATFVFRDESISYEDNEKQFKLNWHLLQRFSVFEDHFFIFFKGGNLPTFIISKDEVSDNDYHEIHDILVNKLSERQFDTQIGANNV